MPDEILCIVCQRQFRYDLEIGGTEWKQARWKLLRGPKSLTELVSEKLMDMIVNGSLELGLTGFRSAHCQGFRCQQDTRARSPQPSRDGRPGQTLSGRREPLSFPFPQKSLCNCVMHVCALEKTAFQTAIANNPEELHARLTDVVQQMTEAREAGDDNLYLSLDTVFHQCLFDCSKNQFLNDAYQAISKKMAAIRNPTGQTSRPHEQVLQRTLRNGRGREESRHRSRSQYPEHAYRPHRGLLLENGHDQVKRGTRNFLALEDQVFCHEKYRNTATVMPIDNRILKVPSPPDTFSLRASTKEIKMVKPLAGTGRHWPRVHPPH